LSEPTPDTIRLPQIDPPRTPPEPAPLRFDSARIVTSGHTEGVHPAPEIEDSSRRRSPTVRMRILTAVLITTALGMLVAGGLSYLIARNQVQEEVYHSLGQEVEELHRNTSVSTNPDTGLAIRTLNDVLHYAIKSTYPDSDEAVLGLINGKVELVPDADGHPLQVTVQQDKEFIAAAAAIRPGQSPGVYRITTTLHPDLAYISVPIQMTGSQDLGHYVTAIDMDTAFDAINRNYLAFASVSAISLVLIGVVGYAVAGQLLAPLRSLRRTAQRISDTDLSDRIPEDQLSSRDEVADLGRTMNAMLDRLANSFDGQRRFLDDVGHELRTPVTIVRGHLELMNPEDPADVSETRTLALDELDRMQRLVDDLMVLAKSRRPDFVQAAPTVLSDLLISVLDKVTPLANRRWKIDANSDAVVLVDQQRITQALLQLVSNAVRFTEDGQVIALGCRLADNQLQVWVRDEGAGISAEDQKLIFERHGRGRQGRDDHPHGSGLGLTIVTAIAEAHDGRVELTSAPGRGSTFTLIMPYDISTVSSDDIENEEQQWQRS
jgi:two-component system OmpR family sensor kinase